MIKKNNFLFFIFISLAICAQGQNFSWAKAIGGTSPFQEQGNSIVVDSFGNSYTTGFYSGTTDFDPGTGTFNLTSAGITDIFITKLDVNGNFKWAKSIGGTSSDLANCIAIDKWGNIYLTGWFYGSIDFDPGIGTYNLTSNNHDAFILKLDSLGNFKKAIRIGGTSDALGISIAIDTNGNLITGGLYYGTVDFDPGAGTYNLTSAGTTDIFICKLDSSWNLLWAKSMGGSSEQDPTSMTIDSKGNIFMVGWFLGYSDFDPGTSVFGLTSSGGSDIFILKLNSLGNFEWAKKLGSGVYDDIGFSITVDHLGFVYTTGYFNGVVDFDPGAGSFTLTTSGGRDIFLSKLDSSGNFVTAKRIGGVGSEEARGISIDARGNLFITGYFESTVDFDPGSATFNLTSAGGAEIFYLKLDTLLNLAWAENSGGTSSDYGLSIYVDMLERVYITGAFAGTGDFDPSSGIFNLTASGGNDIFVIKLCSPPYPKPTILGSRSACIGITQTFSVNLVNNAEGYTWNVPPGASIISGQNTNTINMKFGSGSGYIKVTPYNRCGYGMMDSIFVKSNPLPNININVVPNSTICSGNSVTLSGSGALYYNWTGGVINGLPFIPIATTTFTLTGIDSNGCSNTKTVIITVNPSPFISTHPSNQSIHIGGEAMFTVSSSTANITYQWQQNSGLGFINLINSVQYTGVNSDTLRIKNVPLSYNNYHYRCIITLGTCSSISDTALLNFCSVAIIDQPVNQKVKTGATALFAIKANVINPTFQWQINTGNGFIDLINNLQYSGVSNDSLIILNTQISQSNFIYRCIVTNGNCTAISDTVNLIVCDLIINKNPTNQVINSASYALFIIGSLNPGISYQWQQNDGNGFVNLSNAGQFTGVNNDTLIINDVSIYQSGYSYRCVIYDLNCSDTSLQAQLDVVCLLELIQQPQNQTSFTDSTVTFSVTSTSMGAQYQWQQNSGTGFINLFNFGQYSGTNTRKLSISGLLLSQNNYNYQCIATEKGCSDTSKIAVLYVKKDTTQTIGIHNGSFKNDFSVYPNPFNNSITISSVNTHENIMYRISDETGRQILIGNLNSSSAELELSLLTPGFYILTLMQNSNSNNYKIKLLKQ